MIYFTHHLYFFHKILYTWAISFHLLIFYIWLIYFLCDFIHESFICRCDFYIWFLFSHGIFPHNSFLFTWFLLSIHFFMLFCTWFSYIPCDFFPQVNLFSPCIFFFIFLGQVFFSVIKTTYNFIKSHVKLWFFSIMVSSTQTKKVVFFPAIFWRPWKNNHNRTNCPFTFGLPKCVKISVTCVWFVLYRYKSCVFTAD